MERGTEEIVWCAEVKFLVGCVPVDGDISRQLEVSLDTLAMISEGISEKKSWGKSLFCLFIKKYQNMYFFQ